MDTITVCCSCGEECEVVEDYETDCSVEGRPITYIYGGISDCCGADVKEIKEDDIQW